MATHAIAERLRDPKLRLLAAILSGRQSVREIPTEDWSALIALADTNHVLFTLFSTVKQTAPELATAPMWERLRELTFANAIRHLRLEQAQIEINAAFMAAGIPTIWLKGIALAKTVYPQPALRRMVDLDVLVPFERRVEALRVAQAVGFDFGAIFQLSGIKNLEWDHTHHYWLRRTQGGIDVSLEIHYRIINEGEGIFPRKEELWFFEQIDRSKESLPMLKPEAFLLHLCAHALMHHKEDRSTLSRFYDIHLLVTRKTINWPLLIERAVILRWSYAVEHALTVTQYLFETPFPQDVFEQLSVQRAPDEDISYVTKPLEERNKVEAALTLLRRLTFPQEIRLILDQLFPSRRYLKVRYHLPSWVPIWLYYPRRWIEQAGIMLAWVGKRIVRRLRHWTPPR